MTQVEDRPSVTVDRPSPVTPPNQEASGAVRAPAAPPLSTSTDFANRWFLGLDIGTTGLSAVLFDRLTCQLYPLYWQDGSASPDPQADHPADRRFRLPARSSESIASSIADSPAVAAPETSLYRLKPYLNIGIPYYAAATHSWQPVLQWSNQQQVPLHQIKLALQQLLLTLKGSPAAGRECGALGLEPAAFSTALQQLTGVIVGCSAHASAAYRFNVRECVLASGLVPEASAIYLVEESLATLLSTLRHQSIRFPQGQNATLYDSDWQGHTIVLNAGAAVTELAHVALSDLIAPVTYSQFHFRSIAYAGQAIDQDVLCHLLYPALRTPDPIERWQDNDALLSIDPIDLNAIQLDHSLFPTPGEPDPTHRARLQQQLESSQAGQQLLATARWVKIALQQQNRCPIRIGNRLLILLRQDLGSQILLPYIQRLNRELNSLLSEAQVPASAVRQVICTGGTASFGSIVRWLQQKLPNATIVQDTYARPSGDDTSPSCSRVAYGLAALPLHRQLFEELQPFPSELFLLQDLLRVCPKHPVTADELLHLLQRQGWNGDQVRNQVMALLNGQLPTGLIPAEADAPYLTLESQQNPDYQAMQLAPLFQKQGNAYRTNRYQWEQLQEYLEAVLADAQQRPTSRLLAPE